MDALAAIPWAGLSLSGVLLLAVLMVLRGDIVPRSILADMKAERDEWRTFARELMVVNQQGMAAAETNAHVLESALPVKEPKS